MIPIEKTQDSFYIWREDAFPDLELLKAQYTDHAFPRHFHTTYAIEVIEQGVNQFQCDGKLYTAGAGTIIIFNPGQIHSGMSLGKEGVKYRALYPTVEMLSEISLSIGGSAEPVFSQPLYYDSYVSEKILQTHKIIETNPNSLEAESSLCLTLTDLIQKYCYQTKKKEPTSSRFEIELVCDYILENIDKKISLNDLSKVAGLSKFHLLRTFQRCMGLTPNEYIINVRVNMAKKLLRENYPPIEVAQKTGFYDQSHLSRHFKGIVGTTPGRYNF